MTWQDVQRFTILRHGASGDLDPLPVEDFCEFVIAERLRLGLIFDEIGDGVFHAGVAEVLARIGLHAMPEKELQLEDAMRCGHVFARDSATDRRLMHTDLIGHLGHVQRAKKAGALL